MGLYEHWPYANFHELNLDWIVKQMSVIKEEMEEIKAWHDDWQEELENLDDEYKRILEMYDQLESDFIQFKKDVNDNFDALTLRLMDQIAAAESNLQRQIDIFKAQVNYELDGFQTQLTAMDNKLDEALEHIADHIYMFNPFTGQEEPVTQVIGYLASLHMEDAITAGEYDALAITAGYYDGLNLTAYQYDITAKQYLN